MYSVFVLVPCVKIYGIDNNMGFVNVDGNYFPQKDGNYRNSDGTRILVKRGSTWDGCYAIKGVANEDCFPRNRFAHYEKDPKEPVSGLYTWGDTNYGESSGLTECQG